MNSGIPGRWLLSVFVVLGMLRLFFIGGKLGSPANVQTKLQTGTGSGILVIPPQT